MTIAKAIRGVDYDTIAGHLEGEFELKQMEARGNRSRKSASYHAKDPQTLQISTGATNQDNSFMQCVNK